MSTIREYEEFDDDDDVIELKGEETEEVEAAIAEADANPGAGIEWNEFMRRLRNGE